MTRKRREEIGGVSAAKGKGGRGSGLGASADPSLLPNAAISARKDLGAELALCAGRGRLRVVRNREERERDLDSNRIRHQLKGLFESGTNYSVCSS